MRGIPILDQILEQTRGITPACAGNTQHQKKAHRTRQDHPRVCGEYVTQILVGIFVAGSPPRVRGILRDSSCDANALRITPACAGNTFEDFRAASLDEDHPRVCGEYKEFSAAQAAGRGSPPRVRGIHADSRHLCPLSGITPACAGNTRRSPQQGARLGDHPRVCGEYYRLILCPETG